MADAATCDPITRAQARLDQAITHEAIAAAQYARAVSEAQEALAAAKQEAGQ
jgi:hypothetical protein